jgi:hypothetical protein
MAFPRDGEPYLVPGEIPADLPAAVPLVPHDAMRSPLGPTRPDYFTAPPAMSWSNTLASWRGPGLRRKVMSLPPPSARTCTLVLKPPGSALALRPPEPFFCPRRVLMRPHGGAIHVMPCPVDLAIRIGLGLHRRKDALPNPALCHR